MNLADGLGPRGAAVGCGLGAAGLGLAYMAAGGAPASYLMINAAALAFGLVTLCILVLADRRTHLAPGPVNLLLGLILLAVSLWGVTAGGVTRWVALGPLIIQPGLMVVPLMAVLFARSRDDLSLAGVALAALALALQPDRGMSGALAAGLAVLAFARPDRLTLAAAGASVLGLGAALMQPDPSPAMPFVDQILYSSFAIHPLAGAAVVLGSVLLVAPALATLRARGVEPTACAVFGAVWAAIVVAAALGNYPTPVVGYGGSAIVGYFLSLIVFSRRSLQPEPGAVEVARQAEDDGPVLYAGLS
ncbi:MAG: hypothetical protein M3Q74_09455 [Pseudomonadota bacterium]|nr:hypothetical protein [Pseudomonadota bacterium]